MTTANNYGSSDCCLFKSSGEHHKLNYVSSADFKGVLWCGMQFIKLEHFKLKSLTYNEIIKEF